MCSNSKKLLKKNEMNIYFVTTPTRHGNNFICEKSKLFHFATKFGKKKGMACDFRFWNFGPFRCLQYTKFALIYCFAWLMFHLWVEELRICCNQANVPILHPDFRNSLLPPALISDRVCVCVCLCVFISVHRKCFSWLNRTMDVLTARYTGQRCCAE